jgi:uncharacterized protein (DUF4415 family)
MPKRGADIVRINAEDLPPLSADELAALEALALLPDEAIDVSEIAPLDAAFFQSAKRGQFYRPLKTSTTVRIDADVLAWLRAQGRGYQTRLNAILRKEMLAALQRGKR